MQKVKRFASVAALASASFFHQGILRAQSDQQPQTQQVQHVKTSGIILNQSDVGNDSASTTLSETYLDFGKNRNLWIVGGQSYDQNLLFNSSDFGLKYTDGKNLFRVTARDDMNLSGNFDVSYGFDTQTYVNKDLTILGDVSDLKYGEKRYTDFGIGPQIKIYKKESVFFIYSRRDESNNYRFGYLLDGEKNLFSILTDYKEGAKPSVTGFLSIESKYRFIEIYDPNTTSLSSINLFGFGNKPFPGYVVSGLLKEQYILTTRSVVDSDNTVVFPASFFVEPKYKYSDVLRISVSAELMTNKIPSAFLDNAFMISRKGRSGYIFTQNLTKSRGATALIKPELSYGAGFGYRFEKHSNLEPIVSINSKGITFKLSTSF